MHSESDASSSSRIITFSASLQIKFSRRQETWSDSTLRKALPPFMPHGKISAGELICFASNLMYVELGNTYKKGITEHGIKRKP